VPAALVESWGRRGVALRTIYGISEAGSTVTMSPPGAVPEPGDVGVPLWHLRCQVTDGGRVCAPGEPGELRIAGASVMPGYWRRPDATAQAIVDGWLHTGDVAVIGADGHVRIVDRIKDMYISGGENVYPAEVEEVLYHHPAVAEVAVVGALPRNATGKVLKASLRPVTKDGAAKDGTAMDGTAEDGLARLHWRRGSYLCSNY
jgi:fatty-acyl-CoA synthase